MELPPFGSLARIQLSSVQYDLVLKLLSRIVYTTFTKSENNSGAILLSGKTASSTGT